MKKKEKVMRIFNWIRNILFAVAVVIIIFAAACFVWKLKPAIVMSGSMEPTFHVGSLAVVKQGSSYKIGDPIAFYWGSEYVTHRLVDTVEENGETLYVTKGDANETKDPQLLTSGNIDGKVIFSIPLVGYGLHFASTKKGMIIIGALMLCLMLSLFMVGSDEEEAEETSEKNSKHAGMMRRC